MYHGSPWGGIDRIEPTRPGLPVFATDDPEVARQYARGQILHAQRDRATGLPRRPTVYEVEVDPGRICDMRLPGCRRDYERARGIIGRSDAEDRWPALNSEGFIMSHSRLPGFSFFWRVIGMNSALGTGYDSVWLDEGNQGISLALIDPRRMSIVGSEEA